MKQIHFTLDGRAVCAAEGTKLEALLGERGKDSLNPAMIAQVGSRIREFSYAPKEGDDVRLFDLSDALGSRAYVRGMLHIFLQAVNDVLPGARADIEHSMNEGIYCELHGGEPLTPFSMERIERRMHEISAAGEPFVRKLISRDDAIALYEKDGQEEKARLLHFREDKVFKVYSCGTVTDYFYGHMPPSTDYIRRFKLVYSAPGCVLVYPRRSAPEAELRFTPSPKLSHVFRQSERWADILECGTVADLNEMTERGELPEFIRVNEALHEKEIASIAGQIVRQQRRVVLVAGPSSSGKTTFAQRLCVQLRAAEKRPILISLDNYYRDRDSIERQSDGSIDLENINTLNLPLLNEQLALLLAGKEVLVPRFDFKQGKSVPGRTLRLGPNDILMMEGIHGLNDAVSEAVAADDKFKVFISALTQLNLDLHNRIPASDVRLLRRMVRDHTHRGASVERTFSMWESVRAGEMRWIVPYQESCDAMFNSTLVYELLFLKQLAYPLLRAVPENDPCYVEANLLVKFLKYFVDPGEEAKIEIPRTSILREFIGGGCFEQ